VLSHSKVRFPAVADSAGSLTAKPKAAQLDGFIDFRPALRRSGRGIAFGGDGGVARVDFSSDAGMSWYETELGKDEGNIQFPTMADARMAYKAPIEPKDVDAIFEYLISIRGTN
jgi:hypothetical protein